MWALSFDRLWSNTAVVFPPGSFTCPSIYDYLLKKGIEKERMTFVGLSNFHPLYKNPRDEAQSSANRRVEIKVVSIE